MPTKPQLPPPPDQQPSAWANLLGGVRNMLGMNPPQPVAQSRFTRTPIYSSTGADWPENKGGEYRDGRITVRQDELQSPESGQLITHESAHDIFQRAGLTPLAGQLLARGPELPTRATSRIYSNPQLYVNPAKDDALLANEGLAYSLGWPQGTPYVEWVASQIQDPALAQQLLRMHQNRIEANFYTDPNTPPLRIVGRKGKPPLVK